MLTAFSKQTVKDKIIERYHLHDADSITRATGIADYLSDLDKVATGQGATLPDDNLLKSLFFKEVIKEQLGPTDSAPDPELGLLWTSLQQEVLDQDNTPIPGETQKATFPAVMAAAKESIMPLIHEAFFGTQHERGALSCHSIKMA